MSCGNQATGKAQPVWGGGTAGKAVWQVITAATLEWKETLLEPEKGTLGKTDR